MTLDNRSSGPTGAINWATEAPPLSSTYRRSNCLLISGGARENAEETLQMSPITTCRSTWPFCLDGDESHPSSVSRI